MAVARGRAKRSAGLTLVEFLLVIGISSVLLGLAAPFFTHAIHNARLSALTNDLLADLGLTRSEAIRRGQRVVLCKAAGEAACASSGDWNQGWLMFVDANNNAWLDAGEHVLRHRAPTPAGWGVEGNTWVSSYVSYHPLGRTLRVNGAFQAGTITICRQSASATQARQIVINSMGRPRVQAVELPRCG